MQAPKVGEIVHYVMPDGRNPGEDRPAIVVRVWDAASPTIQLQVFTDGTNDSSWDGAKWTNPEYAAGIAWKTSVRYSHSHEFGTWHHTDEELD